MSVYERCPPTGGDILAPASISFVTSSGSKHSCTSYIYKLNKFVVVVVVVVVEFRLYVLYKTYYTLTSAIFSTISNFTQTNIRAVSILTSGIVGTDPNGNTALVNILSVKNANNVAMTSLALLKCFRYV